MLHESHLGTTKQLQSSYKGRLVRRKSGRPTQLSVCDDACSAVLNMLVTCALTRRVPVGRYSNIVSICIRIRPLFMRPGEGDRGKGERVQGGHPRVASLGQHRMLSMYSEKGKYTVAFQAVV
jgi:hypothetical protein